MFDMPEDSAYLNFINYLWEYVTNHPHERFGQSAFNALYELHPELADEIRGTDIDPFYKTDNKTLTAFMNKVSETLD